MANQTSVGFEPYAPSERNPADLPSHGVKCPSSFLLLPVSNPQPLSESVTNATLPFSDRKLHDGQLQNSSTALELSEKQMNAPALSNAAKITPPTPTNGSDRLRFNVRFTQPTIHSQPQPQPLPSPWIHRLAKEPLPHWIPPTTPAQAHTIKQPTSYTTRWTDEQLDHILVGGLPWAPPYKNPPKLRQRELLATIIRTPSSIPLHPCRRLLWFHTASQHCCLQLPHHSILSRDSHRLSFMCSNLRNYDLTKYIRPPHATVKILSQPRT
ncbi:hypothetical protein BU15DRAFT_78956 [Melanogaster broomeanus]|nr:hypothetical protein BU15DRAFT_78956 [Melanogaster broomeanus]